MKKLMSFYCGAIILVFLCLPGCSEDKNAEDPENHFTYKGVDYPLKSGYIENYGSYDNIYNLDMYLVSSGIYYNDDNMFFEGKGHMVYLEMYCSESCLKSGTYNFDPYYEGDAGTFDIGMFAMNFDLDSFTGTFVYVSSGSVTVSETGSNFEITFNCRTTDNETFKGYYKGELKAADDPGNAPLLLVPAENETLDNGCITISNVISWYFDWSDYPDATMYHLYVTGPNATLPMIDTMITYSQYMHTGYGYISDTNRNGWTWKVRAYVGGEWLPWSAPRVFNVEPADTDCP